MGKPRMTQRDKWKKRPCVMRYRAYKDELNLNISKYPDLVSDLESGDVIGVSWVAVLPMPKSWSKKKKLAMKGRYHRQKPDRDNIDKGILDAILKDDSGVAVGSMTKIWDDGEGARIMLEFMTLEEDK